MSSLDLDIDSQMNNLEAEWRQAYESSITLRGEYQALAATQGANARTLGRALERLEDAILGKDS
jgi:hypothetical protein